MAVKEKTFAFKQRFSTWTYQMLLNHQARALKYWNEFGKLRQNLITDYFEGGRNEVMARAVPDPQPRRRQLTLREAFNAQDRT